MATGDAAGSGATGSDGGCARRSVTANRDSSKHRSRGCAAGRTRAPALAPSVRLTLQATSARHRLRSQRHVSVSRTPNEGD